MKIPSMLARYSLAASLTLLAVSAAHAAPYAETISMFKHAGESRHFFKDSYAYAVFPNVGEGGFIVGAALGTGKVYVQGHATGTAKMTQVSAGFQAGGKVFSQIIFFENKSALDQFESGNFGFSAGASAIAITASAGASAGTGGAQAGASGTEDHATTTGAYVNGMAVFTVAKGGLMYAAVLAGQKFSFDPHGTK